MNRAVARICGAALLALVMSVAVPAQQQGQQEQKPPTPPAKEGAPAESAPEVPKPSPEEEAAYKEFTAATEARPVNAQRIISLGESFVQKFPESLFNASVYSSLATAYQANNQMEKMFAAGMKAIELNPDQVDALALMAWATPRAIRGDEVDVMQRLQRSEEFAKRGIELLQSLEKPASVSEENFTRSRNAKLSWCHSGLGLVYIHTQRWADAVSELEKATRVVDDPDAVDFYLLGLAYRQAGRPHEAVAAFEKCIAGNAPGNVVGDCWARLDDAKKAAATTLKPPAL